MFIHNNEDVKYRNPRNAVPDSTKVSMKITGDRNCFTIYLITVFNDAAGSKIKMDFMRETGGAFWYGCDLTVRTGLYFYYFEIHDGGAVNYFGKNGLHDTNGNLDLWQITVYDENFKTPGFVKGGIMYHIFVDRFNKSGEVVPRKGFIMRDDWGGTPYYKPDEKGIVKNNDVFGGNLQGITEKLDYLKSLNVNIIYLSPVFEASSNHKYNTADYGKIDGMFGSDEDFDRLIAEAAERGIKIILDGVFNHTGDDSIYFNRYGTYQDVGAYQSRDSKYFNWYTFNNYPDDYECWWGVKTLPCVKKEAPVFRAFICGINGIIEKWLKRGAGGFRIDVADELSDRMLKGIHRAVKDMSEENIVIGEVWEDASNKIAYGMRKQYLLGKQLDSVMNYPLKDAVIGYMLTGDSSLLKNTMMQLINNYPKPVLDSLMNILGTHDTARILTVLGSDNIYRDKDEMAESKLNDVQRKKGVELLKMAAILQFTLPGFPCIYYGDEAGLEGCDDPFNRRCYPWGHEDEEILEWYRKLSGIRKNNKVFADGVFELIYENQGIFFFVRKGSKGNMDDVYVCVNLSSENYRFKVDTFESLLTGEQITEIPKYSGDIFIKQSTYLEYYI